VPGFLWEGLATAWLAPEIGQSPDLLSEQACSAPDIHQARANFFFVVKAALCISPVVYNASLD
jgi:hypothetical protein